MSRHLWWLAGIAGLYLLLGLGYSLVVPLGESPDEVDHVRYVQLLAETGRFPVMQPIAADNDTMEANQPPLYYLAGALVWGNPPAGDTELVTFDFAPCFPPDPADPGRKQFYLHNIKEQFSYAGTDAAFWRVRLVSLLMGVGTVLLTYVLGRQLVPEDNRPALLATALVAFNPQFLFISAGVNNDNLTALLGAAIVAASVAVVRQLRPGRVLLLAILLALAALTKLALFALYPLAFLAVGWAAYRSAGDWPGRVRRAVLSLATLVLVPLLTAGWWYLRARRLYGDPLAWEVHLQAKGASVLRAGPFTPADLGDFLVQHFQSYWATFGWLNIQPPAIIFWLLLALLITAAAGLFLVLKERINQPTQHPPSSIPGPPSPVPGPSSAIRRPPSAVSGPRSPVPGPIYPLLLNLAAVLLIYLSLLRYIQTINFSGYQGRLAFAVAGSIAALLALGLWRIGGRLLGWISAVGMLVLAIYSLVFVLLPAFPRPEIYQPVAPSERMCARFGGWQLEAITVPEAVLPGEVLPVTLHGYGLAVSDAPTQVTVDLVGLEGVVEGEVSEIINPPGRKPFTVTLFLPVAETARPAEALLRIRPDDPIQLTNARGQPLEPFLPLTIVVIEP